MEGSCFLPRLTHEILNNHIVAPQERISNIILEKRVHHYIRRLEKSQPLPGIYHRTYIFTFYFKVGVEYSFPRDLALSIYVVLYSSDKNDLPFRVDLEAKENANFINPVLDSISEIIAPIIIAYRLPHTEKYERYVTAINYFQEYERQK